MNRESNLNLPNLVSSVRILIAPLLLVLAYLQQANAFLAALLFSGFTDVLDGYLARKLNQITALGARLDSWGDFTIYSCMAIGAWILWPEIVVRELPYFILIIGSICLPVLVGLIRFRSLTSYHTVSVKVAVVVTFVSYLLLFAGIAELPFRLSSMLCLYAGLEEILISLNLRHVQVDIPSLWQVLKKKRRLLRKK
jgi:CDP-diacylglycerol--glycerol-3-phosphate 3-phosphatidyltransferase